MPKPHKVMTPQEYAAMSIIGWHSVCRNVDGFGNVGIQFQDEAQQESCEFEVQCDREYRDRMRR